MSFTSSRAMLAAVCGAVVVIAGCDAPREKVLDVKAPGFSLEVEKEKPATTIDLGQPAEKPIRP